MKQLVILCCILVCSLAQAQDLRVINSPVINADGTVTFQVNAPKAKRVDVKGQFMSGSTSLKKNAEGIWSATVKPAKADIYPYNFIIDGVTVADPGNPLLFPNENFKSSLLEMPDNEALYTVHAIPHGKVHYCSYKSHVLNQYRNMVVYTPAEYDTHTNKQYPVFYLVSGTTDTEETWFKAGRANTILDNLIERGKAEPMIIVMPYGYMNNGTPRPSTMEAAEMYDTFARELTECIMPYIEKNYRTLPDRDHRAIAGFSRGGGQSMFTALKHIDKFAWLGSYSAYLTPEVMEKHFPNLSEEAKQLKMLWFGVGRKDFLYQDVVRNQQYFDDNGIPYQSVATEGSHTWMHARFCLAETLQQLFRETITESEKFPGVAIDDHSLPGFTIYRPFDLPAAVEREGRLPVLVFGNGACTHYSADYAPMFAELVTNGYIVMAVGSKDGKIKTRGRDASGAVKEDNLLDAVDWINKQHVTPGSDYYGLVDIFHIAAAGHSCGGAQAMAASYDPRITTTILHNAGMGDMSMGGATPKSLKELHAPILYLIGGPEDVAYFNAALDFERINHVPVASANYAVGHAGTYKQPQGGILGKVTRMWLDWLLKGKKEASAFFLNADFRDKNYPGCEFESKGMEKIEIK
ncbi:enterochelin esterase-like enzyme [Parabacteroides sp. PFB2-12]|uniref:alpha/beta hydrolase-fold protein n=1 Tax=unclassified Parabacteroides TaxID=2649774 RepID=UPI002472E8F7|nr:MULTISPECIES: alpha/beta hydrolase-fold protein [unclassified Parabacteroides]MDH6342794.1 enterochelin esterase-like enzyme [Parabacteroides sp. PM6-13]MDH6390576.1 enterochelin esterase-like enzyme [Parabacteroides sp. PFB2-12]